MDILKRVMSYRGGELHCSTLSSPYLSLPHRLHASGAYKTCRHSLHLTDDVMQDRRRIEKEAFEGHLLGIVATNALELGVDIGVLDAVMMFGFPRGGVASFVSSDPCMTAPQS